MLPDQNHPRLRKLLSPWSPLASRMSQRCTGATGQAGGLCLQGKVVAGMMYAKELAEELSEVAGGGGGVTGWTGL